MRALWVVMAFSLFCLIPRQVWGQERRAVASKPYVQAKRVPLQSLMLRSPFDPKYLQHSLAAPPQDDNRVSEIPPQILFIDDAAFLERRETRFIYGQ